MGKGAVQRHPVPQWTSILKNLAGPHEPASLENLALCQGVFLIGQRPLALQLSELCELASDVGRKRIFIFRDAQVDGGKSNAHRFEVQLGVEEDKRVHERIGLTHVRSGGQTGVDTAGLVAGMALGIPVTGLYPRGSSSAWPI